MLDLGLTNLSKSSTNPRVSTRNGVVLIFYLCNSFIFLRNNSTTLPTFKFVQPLSIQVCSGENRRYGFAAFFGLPCCFALQPGVVIISNPDISKSAAKGQLHSCKSSAAAFLASFAIKSNWVTSFLRSVSEIHFRKGMAIILAFSHKNKQFFVTPGLNGDCLGKFYLRIVYLSSQLFLGKINRNKHSQSVCIAAIPSQRKAHSSGRFGFGRIP
jgi:hypothetical protein